MGTDLGSALIAYVQTWAARFIKVKRDYMNLSGV